MDHLENYWARLGEEGSIDYTNSQEKVMGSTVMTGRNREPLVYAEKLQVWNEVHKPLYFWSLFFSCFQFSLFKK